MKQDAPIPEAATTQRKLVRADYNRVVRAANRVGDIEASGLLGEMGAAGGAFILPRERALLCLRVEQAGALAVIVRGGSWTRYTGDVSSAQVRTRVSLTVDGGGSSGNPTSVATISLTDHSYIVAYLDNALRPTTLNVRADAAEPTGDTEHKERVLAYVELNAAKTAILRVWLWHEGGNLQDEHLQLDDDSLDYDDTWSTWNVQLRRWSDALNCALVPTPDADLFPFKYHGDNKLYYATLHDMGVPVYDNASINDNSSTQWQIYGFETATSSPPTASDLFPYKASGVIQWTDLSDLADVIAPELPESEHSHHSLVAHDAETMSDGDGQGEYDDHGGQARLDGAGYTAGLDNYRYMLLGTYTDRPTTYARNLPPSGGADDASCIGNDLYVQHEGHFGDDGADIFKADLAIDAFWAGHFVDGVCTANLATGTEAGQFHDGSISVKLAVHGGAAVEVVAGDVTIDPAYALYWGNPTDADTWRIAVSGGALVFERYDGAAWVECGRFTAA